MKNVMEQFNSTILFSALTEAILFKSSHLAVEKKKEKNGRSKNSSHDQQTPCTSTLRWMI